MVYEKFLTKDEISQLNNEDKKLLKKEEDMIVGVFTIVLILGFLLLVASIAMVIWSTKVTLFISCVVFVPFIFFTWAYNRICSDYRIGLKALQEHINSQKKQGI